MALRLTLKPNERIVINGCVVQNSDRRQMITIENHADVVREADLLKEDEARTPVKEVYFLIQASLLDRKVRDKLVPVIQKKLGQLVPVFHDDMSKHIFDAAHHVSAADFYNAMRALRPVMSYEAELFEMINSKAKQSASG